jgi:hypothetical protein
VNQGLAGRHDEANAIFRDESRFSEAHGWMYRDETVDGRTVLVSDAMEATPHNVSYIWYAPNHVRAFRRDLYEKVGGYDDTLTVGAACTCNGSTATTRSRSRKPTRASRS